MRILTPPVEALMSKWADALLSIFGMSHNATLAIVLYSILVLFVSIAVGLLFRWILISTLKVVNRHSKREFLSLLLQRRFFSSLASLLPPSVYLVSLQITYDTTATLTRVLITVTMVYMICRFIIATNKFINTAWTHFDKSQNKRRLPLRGIAQLTKGVVLLLGLIVSVAIVLHKSPGALLAGLGAFAAVLMLVFRDSILGVVAGVQLSMEDALHVGDWIKVPGTGADGSVEEVNLISIKVRNWDNTTTMLPPYSLVSGSYTNYRSMQAGGCRRIFRSLLIDADSVRGLDVSHLDAFRGIKYMDEYITGKVAQCAAGIEYDYDNPAGLVDGTISTNLGLLRAYVKMHILRSPDFARDQMVIVGLDQQTPEGIPLFVYCFTATSRWTQYTAIESSLFEHILAVLPKFELAVAQAVTSRSDLGSGYLRAGNSPSDLFGIPEKFLV